MPKGKGYAKTMPKRKALKAPGSGMAYKAGSALRSRKARMDAAISGSQRGKKKKK